jgi:hypothetical protein
MCAINYTHHTSCVAQKRIFLSLLLFFKNYFRKYLLIFLIVFRNIFLQKFTRGIQKIRFKLIFFKESKKNYSDRASNAAEVKLNRRKTQQKTLNRKSHKKIFFLLIVR